MESYWSFKFMLHFFSFYILLYIFFLEQNKTEVTMVTFYQSSKPLRLYCCILLLLEQKYNSIYSVCQCAANLLLRVDGNRRESVFIVTVHSKGKPVSKLMQGRRSALLTLTERASFIWITHFNANEAIPSAIGGQWARVHISSSWDGVNINIRAASGLQLVQQQWCLF